jgi:hypothetical protein
MRKAFGYPAGHMSITMPGLIGAEVHVESSATLHFF